MIGRRVVPPRDPRPGAPVITGRCDHDVGSSVGTRDASPSVGGHMNDWTRSPGWRLLLAALWTACAPPEDLAATDLGDGGVTDADAPAVEPTDPPPSVIEPVPVAASIEGDWIGACGEATFSLSLSASASPIGTLTWGPDDPAVLRGPAALEGVVAGAHFRGFGTYPLSYSGSTYEVDVQIAGTLDGEALIADLIQDDRRGYVAVGCLFERR